METQTLPRHFGRSTKNSTGTQSLSSFYYDDVDSRRFSTLEPAAFRTYKKRREQSRRPMGITNTLSPLLYGTLEKDTRFAAQLSQLSLCSSMSSYGQSPSRTDECISSLRSAYSELLASQSTESEKLQQERQTTSDPARITGLNDELTKVEELRSKCQWFLQRLDKLNEQSRMAKITSAKAKSSSLSDLRASLVSSKPPVIDPVIEKELQSLMGNISVEIKAVVGFARVTPGDVFEVSIKHGVHKWKGKGKTRQDRSQKWDKHMTTFYCAPAAGIDIKVCEGGLLKSKVLCERSFDPCELLSPQPQLVTLNLNAIGSIKLQLIVTWLPPISSLPPPTPSVSLSSSSSESSEVRRPRVLLREKKRGGAARNALKSEWRSSTNILDDLYSDISKNIPTMDEMSSARGTLSSTRSPLTSINRRSLSLAYLTSSTERDSSCASSSSSSIDDLRSLVSSLIPLTSSLDHKFTEARKLSVILNKWQRILETRSSPRVFSREEDMDDNVLMSSEDDSGVDSLRGATEGRERRRRRSERESSGAIDVQLIPLLMYHLSRVERGIESLSSHQPSSLVYKLSLTLRALDSEVASLDELIDLSSHPLPNLSNLLVHLEADSEVHEVWLSTAFPLRASFFAPLSQLREQLLSRVSLLVTPLYPALPPRVTTTILNLLEDSLQGDKTQDISLFHFVSLFRHRPFAAFVENLSHEIWMVSLLSSSRLSSIQEVIDRLRHIPLAPPLETLSSMASLLSSSSDSRVIRVIEDYLDQSRGQRRVDLLSSFLCLLESDSEAVRMGSLHVLALLKNDRVSGHVKEVSESDSSTVVRKEASRVLNILSSLEITHI